MVVDQSEERLHADRDGGEIVLPEDALPGTREERTAFRTGLKRAGSRSFIILAIIVFLDNLQGSGLSTLAPNIQSSLHVSSGTIVFVAGVSSGFLVLGIVPLGLVGGPLSATTDHRYRHRRVRRDGVLHRIGQQHLHVLPGPIRCRCVPGVDVVRPHVSSGGRLPDQPSGTDLLGDGDGNWPRWGSQPASGRRNRVRPSG